MSGRPARAATCSGLSSAACSDTAATLAPSSTSVPMASTLVGPCSTEPETHPNLHACQVLAPAAWLLPFGHPRRSAEDHGMHWCQLAATEHAA